MRLTIKGASVMKALLAANLVGVRLKNVYTRKGYGKACSRFWIEAETEQITETQVEAWNQMTPDGDGSLIAWRGML